MGILKLTNEQISEIAEFTRLKFGDDVFNRSRLPNFIYKRKIIVCVLFKLGFSLTTIARIIEKHHASVIHIIKNDFKCPDLTLTEKKYENFQYEIVEFLIENNIPFKPKN